MKDASQILSEVLNERKAVNPAYSLRSFARDLGVTPSQLSHVIKGYRGLGPKTANRITIKLGLEGQDQDLFKESLKAKFAPSKAQRVLSRSNLAEVASMPSTRNLQLDLFNTIAQWHHFTLLELIKISTKRKNPVLWFSEKLGLPENEVKVSLDRLERLELISKTTSSYKVNQDAIIADQGVPTEAVKNSMSKFFKRRSLHLPFKIKMSDMEFRLQCRFE